MNSIHRAQDATSSHAKFDAATAARLKRARVAATKHIPAELVQVKNQYTDVPIIGPRLSFFNGINFMMYPQEMCMEGFKKYCGEPFRVCTPTGWTVVISDRRMADEMMRESDELMQPKEATDELLQIPYTAGRQISNDQYHNEVIRIGLNRNLADCAPVVFDEVVAACDDELRQAEFEWATVSVYDVVTKVVSRASNRLFIGLPICRNPDYVKFTIRITFDIFNAASIINFFPKSIQPIIAPFVSKRKKDAREAAAYLAKIAQERLDSIDRYGRDYTDKPNDFLSWLIDETNEERREMSNLLSRLVFVNFAAILSTGLTLLRAIYDLVRHAQYIPELREEIEQVVEAEGFALDKMYKLDSFVRESQRVTPLAPHTMLRKVRRDFTFSDGFSVPAGTIFVLNQAALNLDENIWPDPLRFDPFRYIDEAPTNRLISTSNNWLFGHGRHVCAGRALAVQEIKGIMAYLIMNYDLKPSKASELEGRPLPLFKLISWKANVRKRSGA
ncbi:hypothetical protein EW146_g10129 [Bondarzewia mesenterica]|uniref:Cytochrome P450 n=1 Tax=Bondarzewia mesenterica TaxID=1095465 RepID=A0A4S4L0C3_9AGAM|nr:hypothetical protein EW146_g10129 [Bondarzewia mesenterica]